MSYLTTDLAMATINSAKVVDIDEVVRSAEIALTNHRLSQESKKNITRALDKLKSTDSKHITNDLVNEVDGLLGSVSTITVNEGKAVVNVSGSEHFDLDIMDLWKDSRIAGLEGLLEDLSRDIKRWANKLNAKLNDLFSSNKKAVESLKKGILNLDEYMAKLEGKEPLEKVVVLTPLIDKYLFVNGKSIANKSNVESIINAEVNYIFTVLKNWILETVAYKNKAIRYFGNGATGPLSELYRTHPRFFSKKALVDEKNKDLVFYTPPKEFIGGGSIWFCEHTGKPEDLKEAVKYFELTGYNVLQVGKTDAKLTEINTLKFKQLEHIYNAISKVIEIMEHLNNKSNDFDLSDKDVKDVLSTVKSLDDSSVLKAYGTVFAHYQLDASATQSNFIKYLYNLCDKLIAFVILNLEAYEE